MSRMQELINEYNKKQAEVQAEISRSLSGIFVELLSEYPNVESVGWTQYTPNFNDGDPCYFSVHADPEFIYINGEMLDDLLYDDEDLDPKELEELADKVVEILNCIPNEFLQNIFDEGLITINRDGTSSCKYINHD